ncbi:U3 small nucleolar RNA-associated protein 6 [Ophiocordyceps camponoti-floridani]|uniref:U3 small nucleolar RNA-associated protein 6 n=1 Tax=Ophiocordyceps camponoti-floridani TaxID=2030778 RepID=A0A8H4Q5B9_9HYPO|nr:U3 small nucleolar RNA-associated protein 6 [Ophiocordyceps camponoti-floridani]
MAGVAEKARFYLERSVPQLREWEEKGLFSKDEIRAIVRKRNDFEHRVLSPGNKPSEWSSYAKWEQSLEALRAKRCKRLKIHHLNSTYAGQHRVMDIYERSVNRHPSSDHLWHGYLAYMDVIKAAKRWRKTMISALRMKPTDPDLWIMAGHRSAHNGDMASARSFFMRGCRFCAKDQRLWLEYARCEMQWLAKVDKRKAAQKSDPLRPDKIEDGDEMRLFDSEDEAEDEDADGTSCLPEISSAQLSVIDDKSRRVLESNPAMDGAIPVAIFDVSRKQAFFTPEFAESFFIVITSFRHVSVQSKVSKYVLDAMDAMYPNHPSTCSCHIRSPILGISPHTADFPRGLRDVLARLTEKMESTTDRPALCEKTITWMNEYLAFDDLDEGIKAALELMKEQITGS